MPRRYAGRGMPSSREIWPRCSTSVVATSSSRGIPDRAPSTVVVAGIATWAPDRRGDSIYVSLETARSLIGRDDVATQADVLWGARGGGRDRVPSGWIADQTDAITQGRASVVDLFGLMLRGTGLLGLLLGGVGVSNTMQVLLARRQAEIAVLKTIGYGRKHLVALFGVETAMLGFAGSVAGAAAGLLVSVWFVSLFGRFGGILLDWSGDWRVVLGAVATGTATAVVFGMRAIVGASGVRPATLLRNVPTPPARVEAVVLYGALIALFAAMCAIVLGSVVKGALVATVGFTGLVVLSGILGSAFWLVIRIPIPAPPLIELARRNLRRQTGRVVVALVALVCGIFTIGFAGATGRNGRQRIAARQGALTGANVTCSPVKETVRQSKSALRRSRRTLRAIPRRTRRTPRGPPRFLRATSSPSPKRWVDRFLERSSSARTHSTTRSSAP